MNVQQAESWGVVGHVGHGVHLNGAKRVGRAGSTNGHSVCTFDFRPTKSQSQYTTAGVWIFQRHKVGGGVARVGVVGYNTVDLTNGQSSKRFSIFHHCKGGNGTFFYEYPIFILLRFDPDRELPQSTAAPKMACSLRGEFSTSNLFTNSNESIHRTTFLAQLDQDDDNGNFTAADERFEPLVIASVEYDSECPRPGRKALERGQFAEKMARLIT